MPPTRFDRIRRQVIAVAGAGLVLGASGCAAVTNPAADGIPVRRLPPEAFGESKADVHPVPLTALTPPPAGPYKLAPGDTLGIFIEGVLGERGEKAIPPVQFSQQGNLPPSIGFPIPVRDDGTLPLPLIEPLKVTGLTLEQVQDKIRNAYVFPKKIVKDVDTPRVIVTLIRPRQYHVLVLREDAGGTTFGTSGGFGAGLGSGTFVSQTRRAAGFPLDLPAYENDLLNALTRSGGLPGSEAEDEVIILRGAYRLGTDGQPGAMSREPREAIRVPLRLHPGQTFNVRPEDLILRSGDVVQVRAKPAELFFTGGLLPPRAFPLPADRDLDVLEAVALVGGPLVNGGVNANNLSGQILQTGLGFPSPSQVTILRKLECGAQIPIVVSLNRAVRDPRERIAIRPNDFLILQSTVDEAEAGYFTSNFRTLLNWQFLRSRFFNGTETVTLP
jgi:hypothetical protein